MTVSPFLLLFTAVQVHGRVTAAAMQQRLLATSCLCMVVLALTASTWVTCGAWTCRPGHGRSAPQQR
jgi:hypothetical protein